MTALQAAILHVWRTDVAPYRDLELVVCEDALIHHDSRTAIVTGSIPLDQRYRLEQLGYQHHFWGQSEHMPDWLEYVAGEMRRRSAERPWEQHRDQWTREVADAEVAA